MNPRGIVVGPGYWQTLALQNAAASPAHTPRLFGFEVRVSPHWPRDLIGWLDAEGKLLGVTDLSVPHDRP